MILILFGLPGSGKNYIGKIIEKDYNFLFHDGDVDLTAKMKKSVKRGTIITKKMRKEFYNCLVKKIKKLNKIKNNIVIAQSIPKEKYRNFILKNFPDAKFILIKAKHKIIEGRLLKRKHLASYDYCKKVHKIFEKPKIKYKIINNDLGNKKIRMQLRDFLKKIY